MLKPVVILSQYPLPFSQQTNNQRSRSQSRNRIDCHELDSRHAGERINRRPHHHGNEEEGWDDEEAEGGKGLVAGLGGEGGVGHGGGEVR